MAWVQDYRRVRSEKWVVLIAAIITAAWLVVAAMLLGKLIPSDKLPSYALGSDQGFLPLQLLSYSFIHLSAFELTYSLIWFWGLVNLCRRCCGPAGFIRIYSLGAVGGSLIYLLLLWLLGIEKGVNGEIVYGAMLPNVALLGALAVLEPRKVRLFGNSFGWKFLLIIGWVLSAAIPPFSARPIDATLPAWLALVTLLWNGSELVIAMLYTRLCWVAIAWVSIDSGCWFGLRLILDGSHKTFLASVLVSNLAQIAGLSAGVLYGLTERTWKKYEAKLTVS